MHYQLTQIKRNKYKIQIFHIKIYKYIFFLHTYTNANMNYITYNHVIQNKNIVLQSPGYIFILSFIS